MTSSIQRTVILVSIPVAAIGIAVARGRKEEPVAPAPTPEVAAPVAPVAVTAPALFPDGLPVALTALPAGLASVSAQTCNACHFAAHDTWSGSAHARAWSSPTFQAALTAAGNSTACVQCHLPLAAQHDQLAAGYVDGDLTRPRLTPNPAFDVTLRAEGVTCASCHVRGDTIIGTRPAPNSPHPVAVSTELQTPEMCATCHQLTWPGADRPFYDTYNEWKGSAWAQVGVTCQACHMAPTAGAIVPGTDGTLPSHALNADPARAVTVLLKLPSASVQRGQPVDLELTLQNTGAGHAFPTGNPFTTAQIDVVMVDSAGKDLTPAWTTTFARVVEAAAPFKTVSDNRLAAGGQFSASHSFTPSLKGAPGLGAVEVRLRLGERRLVLQRVPVEVR